MMKSKSIATTSNGTCATWTAFTRRISEFISNVATLFATTDIVNNAMEIIKDLDFLVYECDGSIIISPKYKGKR